MLETLLSGAVGQARWNGIIPDITADTLFRLAGFNTTADIKDRSVNAIPISASWMDVGTDQYGTYMLFNGSGSMELKSTLLDKASVEITMVVGSMPAIVNQYSPPLLDCRPVNTNGNYYSTSITTNNQTLSLITNYPSLNWTTTPIGVQVSPVVIKLIIKDRKVEMWAGGVLLGTHLVTDNGAPATFTNQFIKIGRSAFQGAGVPNFQGRMYYFEIRNIP